MKKPGHIDRANLSTVTGGGLYSPAALAALAADTAVRNVARGWGNLFSWQKQGPNGYE